MIGETKFQATARLDLDGLLSVKVTAITPYGNRSVSTTAEVTDEKIVSKLTATLEVAIKSVRDELKQEAFKHTARAVNAAFENKEAL